MAAVPITHLEDYRVLEGPGPAELSEEYAQAAQKIVGAQMSGAEVTTEMTMPLVQLEEELELKEIREYSGPSPGTDDFVPFMTLTHEVISG